MKICLVIGTRPEIIKMSPIVRECQRKNIDFFVLHTNQHYSYNMDKVFFDDLELPHAKYNLRAGSGTHAKQTGRMLVRMDDILSSEKPDIVIVQGDTNTVLAGALAASKQNLKVGHLEAGLRSFDRQMPEEINRTMADHLSDYLFAPTKVSRQNLLNEGIDKNKIFVTGNTVVDATLKHLKLAEKRSSVLDDLRLDKKKYILTTVHRPENVDNKKMFSEIMTGLDTVAEKFGIEVIYPIHPRSRKMLRKFGLKDKTNNIRFIDPVGYFDFLILEQNAKLIMTDSGGLQEEACILKVPCVTLRENTERPESIGFGANVLAGMEKENIVKSAKTMMNKKIRWRNPFGDGKSGRKVINIIQKEFKS